MVFCPRAGRGAGGRSDDAATTGGATAVVPRRAEGGDRGHGSDVPVEAVTCWLHGSV
jgi:hypothetical protein